MLVIALCLTLATASGWAWAATPLSVKCQALSLGTKQDSLQEKKPRPELIIPDSLKALYRYTEGLK